MTGPIGFQGPDKKWKIPFALAGLLGSIVKACVVGGAKKAWRLVRKPKCPRCGGVADHVPEECEQRCANCASCIHSSSWRLHLCCREWVERQVDPTGWCDERQPK